MPRCIHRAAGSGNQCARNAADGVERCGEHNTAHLLKEQRAGPILEGGCSRILTTGRRCRTQAAAGMTVCAVCHTKNERAAAAAARAAAARVAAAEAAAQQLQAAEQRADALIQEALAGTPNMHWQAVTGRLYAELGAGTINYNTYITIAVRFAAHFGATRLAVSRLTATLRNEAWNAQQRARQEQAEQAAQAEQPALQRIANDGQNVHTAVVTQQTNAGLEKIFATPVPPGQNTMKAILIAVAEKYTLRKTFQRFLENMKDMAKWYETASCVKKDDWQYKRALDGTWALILKSPHKDELIMRLYQEIHESRGMCFAGHMSRLTNIFVGFDDTFKPPISLGEQIQQRMAAISHLDIGAENMRIVANEAFEELGVPIADRAVWLGAFE